MLNPQAQRILDILSDNRWHCDIDWKYETGHGRRFTDINRYLAPKGQKIASSVCDCGRHTSKILKRKIVALEGKTMQPTPKPMQPFTTAYTIGEYCCGDRLRGLNSHSHDCKVQIEKVKQQLF